MVINLGNNCGSDWVRPADWLTLPTLVEGQEKFVGLHAVWDSDSNFLTIQASGAYTVNIYRNQTLVYSESISSSGWFYYNFSYADYSGTECSRGYRQAIVEVIPQSGQSLTYLGLYYKHNQTKLQTSNSSGWLDIKCVGANITTLGLSGPEQNSLAQINHYYLEAIEFIGNHNINNLSYLFSRLYELRYLRFELNNTTTSIYYFGSNTKVSRNCWNEMFTNFSGENLTSLARIYVPTKLSLNLSSFSGGTLYAFQLADEVHLTNIPDNANFDIICYNSRIHSFSCDNAANITSTNNAWTLCYNLRYFSAPGIKISFVLSNAPLSYSIIEDIIMNQLADLTGQTAQTLSLTNCWGTADANMAALAAWASTNKNWTIAY